MRVAELMLHASVAGLVRNCSIEVEALVVVKYLEECRHLTQTGLDSHIIFLNVHVFRI